MFMASKLQDTVILNIVCTLDGLLFRNGSMLWIHVDGIFILIPHIPSGINPSDAQTKVLPFLNIIDMCLVQWVVLVLLSCSFQAFYLQWFLNQCLFLVPT